MITVNVYEAKTHLSRLLRRVRAGEEFVIADAGRPVARVIPFAAPAAPRLGGDEGQVWIAEDFDAPLPQAVLAAFWGEPVAARSKRRSGDRRRRPKR